MLKGKKLGGLLPPGGEGGPEATVVSDEDEAAEMEDEAVRSRVQRKPRVRGGAAGEGQPRGLRRHGMFALPQFSVAATQTLCPPLSVCLPLCLSVSGFLALSVPTRPNL